jgi:hypothetical protein
MRLLAIAETLPDLSISSANDARGCMYKRSGRGAAAVEGNSCFPMTRPTDSPAERFLPERDGENTLPATGKIEYIPLQSMILIGEKGYRLPSLILVNKPFAMTDRAHHLRRALTVFPLIPPLRSAPLNVAFTVPFDDFLSLTRRAYLLVFLTHSCLLLASFSQGNPYVRIAV